MKKLTMKYTEYDGVEREEDFFFNLTKAEVYKMQNSQDGGMDIKLKKIVRAKSQKELVDVFEQILKASYCVKSDDGRRLIKREELTQEFMELPVYSDIYMKLATDANFSADFIREIMPTLTAEEQVEYEKIMNENLGITGTPTIKNDQVANVNTQNFLNGNH